LHQTKNDAEEFYKICKGILRIKEENIKLLINEGVNVIEDTFKEVALIAR
jgi:hypothetical protein